MTIIFYDLYSTTPEIAWSPNTWKARYCLNYKRLDYKTEWVEFPDLEALYKKHAVKPSVFNMDGTPQYSVPLLYDPSTDTYVSDSIAIGEYLDKAYPEPKIFPKNTLALQSLVEDAFIPALLNVVPLSMSITPKILSPVGQAFYIEKKLPPVLVPIGEEINVKWAKFKDGLAKVESWYMKTEGPFFMGDTVSWGDFVIASFLVWLRTIWGKESQEWKNIATWHEGRWQDLLNALSAYEVVC